MAWPPIREQIDRLVLDIILQAGIDRSSSRAMQKGAGTIYVSTSLGNGFG